MYRSLLYFAGMPFNKQRTGRIEGPNIPLAAGPRVATTALGIFVVAALATAWIDWRLCIFQADDSYIHLRIAQHLVHTGHAVFNAGERVMVTSSPLWSVLLGVSSLFFETIPPALPLEAVSVGFACVLAFLLARGAAGTADFGGSLRHFYLALVPACVFALLLQSSVLEMETPLAIVLMLAGIFLWQRDSQGWLAVLVLAGWVRYECFLCAALFVGFGLLLRRLTIRATLFAVAAFAAGAFWLQYQFGTLVPNTVRAKAVAYMLRPAETFGLLDLSPVRCALLLAVLLAILAMALPLKRGRRPIVAPDVFFLFGVLLASLYIARSAFIFPWYSALVRAPIVIGLLLGAMVCRMRWIAVLALVTALAYTPVSGIRGQLVAAVSGMPWRDQKDGFNVRVREYLLVGDALQAACPGARLLTSEIGGLGHGFHGEIADALGLATPAAIDFHPMPVPEERSSGLFGAIPPAFVEQVRPDVIVSYDWFAESLLRRYDRGAYTLHEYSPLPASLNGRFPHQVGKHLYVWVNHAGACRSSALDESIRSSLAAH